CGSGRRLLRRLDTAPRNVSGGKPCRCGDELAEALVNFLNQSLSFAGLYRSVYGNKSAVDAVTAPAPGPAEAAPAAQAARDRDLAAAREIDLAAAALERNECPHLVNRLVLEELLRVNRRAPAAQTHDDNSPCPFAATAAASAPGSAPGSGSASASGSACGSAPASAPAPASGCASGSAAEPAFAAAATSTTAGQWTYL